MAEFASGNIFIREGELETGQIVVGHKHNFDHTTYVPRGAILFEKLGAPTKFAPDIDLNTGKVIGMIPVDWEVLKSVVKRAGPRGWVLIEAGVMHRLTGLEPSTYHCIYSHRTPQGEIVQEYDGWMKALS